MKLGKSSLHSTPAVKQAITRWRCRAPGVRLRILLALGIAVYTLQRPTDDRFLMTTEELENKMAVMLGGRAAEHLFFGKISTGASDDLVKAIEIARSMVTRYGMAPDLGQVVYETERGNFLGQPMEGGGRRFSEQTAREIDLVVKDLVDQAYMRAKCILDAKRSELEGLARLLLEKETLSAAELPEPAALWEAA